MRWSRKPLRRGFGRANDGAVAIEFAMVAFPLCFMLFAILEVALYFTIDTVLDNAVTETGRLIRTGQASADGMTREQFKTMMCSQMSVFSSDCATRATVDVQVIPQFAVPPDPLDDGVFDPSEANNYSNGSPGSLMLVRVWYRQPLFTAYLAKGLSRTNDGTYMLNATTAFRNEPA
ncbi:MAG: pilus assembly protein [Brevundimonas sp.]|nr:MAG: pilus assembly protein [Brevundimonas sp.]